MENVRIVVWMNQPSHYQTAFFDELAARGGVSLSVIYARGQTAERRELGWGDVNQAGRGYRQSVLPKWFPVGQILQCVWRERRAIHLINGVWAVRPFMVAALGLTMVRAVFFFHSEAANPAEERQGLIRRLKHVYGRWMVARSRGIFLIGTKACRYYGTLGVPEEQMFKFSYFVDAAGRPKRGTKSGDVLKICYLGQFVSRKRVGDLISAVSLLHREGRRVRLRLVGAGPLREDYLAQAAAEGVTGLTSVEGPIAPGRVSEMLTEMDVLVLPSTFDGWGLTVNEALHAGVPVVVSDGCGVAEVLSSRPAWGAVFPVGDVPALAAALRRLAVEPTASRPDPAEVVACIGCSRMTDHFLASVNWAMGWETTRPSLPW